MISSRDFTRSSCSIVTVVVTGESQDGSDVQPAPREPGHQHRRKPGGKSRRLRRLPPKRRNRRLAAPNWFGPPTQARSLAGRAHCDGARAHCPPPTLVSTRQHMAHRPADARSAVVRPVPCWARRPLSWAGSGAAAVGEAAGGAIRERTARTHSEANQRNQQAVHDATHEDPGSASVAVGQRLRPSFGHPQPQHHFGHPQPQHHFGHPQGVTSIVDLTCGLASHVRSHPTCNQPASPNLQAR